VRSSFDWRSEPRIVHHHPAFDWLAGAAAALVLVLLLGLGHRIDDDAEQQDAELVSSRAFEAGRRQGREEMAATVRDAYAQGRLDATVALAGGGR